MDDNMLLTANSKGEYPADQSQGPEGGRLRSFLFFLKTSHTLFNTVAVFSFLVYAWSEIFVGANYWSQRIVLFIF